MPRHGAVGRLRWPLADQEIGGDEGLPPSAGARPRHAQRPPGAQTRCQLAAQRAASLHIQRLVDGLVADAHGGILGEIVREALGNLLGTPRPGPPPGLAPAAPAPRPPHARPRDHGAAGREDRAVQPLLYVLLQRGVHRQLRRLWSARGALCMPLRRRRAVLEAAGARGGVAAQLTRDRRRCPGQMAGDRAHALPLGTPERDLLPVGERQIPPRRQRCRRPEVRRCHAACLPKPPCTDRRRHPDVDRRILARASRRDRRPKPPPLLSPPNRGPAWRG